MFRRNMNLLAALWVVLAFVLGSVSEAGQPMIKPESVPTYEPKFYPFEGGEKAVYRTRWNGLVSVATAEIYTTSTMLDGKKVYQVRRSEERRVGKECRARSAQCGVLCIPNV